jgi:hypothetical protein
MDELEQWLNDEAIADWVKYIFKYNSKKNILFTS